MHGNLLFCETGCNCTLAASWAVLGKGEDEEDEEEEEEEEEVRGAPGCVSVLYW